jgi:hypothetical protein
MIERRVVAAQRGMGSSPPTCLRLWDVAYYIWLKMLLGWPWTGSSGTLFLFHGRNRS